MHFSGVRKIGTGVVLAAAVTLAVAACSGEEKVDPNKPFTIGGGSQVAGFTPTPTAGHPIPKPTPTRSLEQPTPTTGEGTPPPTSGDGGRGRELVQNAGCIACHAIPGLSNAAVGPNLAGIGARAGTRKPGMSADAYLRESTQQPGAFVVQGFQNIMPPGLVQGADLDAVVAYLLTLK